MTVQRRHLATRTRGRGPARGNGMPGDQRNRRFVDPSSGRRDMPSPGSHENAVQGQLVNLGLTLVITLSKLKEITIHAYKNDYPSFQYM